MKKGGTSIKRSIRRGRLRVKEKVERENQSGKRSKARGMTGKNDEQRNEEKRRTFLI